MKHITVFVIFFSLVLNTNAQKTSLPNVKVKTLDGKMISIREIQKAGMPMIINFWATWCKPCVKELNAISDIYPDWKDEVDFQFVAVSIDDSRSQHSVAPFVKGRAWDYEVYLDTNSELKRALNVVNIPHTLLFDKQGKLVWQHSGYSDGDEDELFKKILEYAK